MPVFIGTLSSALILGEPVPVAITNILGLGCYAICNTPSETRVAVVPLDFEPTGAVSINTNEVIQQGKIDAIQTVFIDNSGGIVPMTIDVDLSRQHISIPAGHQAIMPLLIPNPNSFVIRSETATPRCNIQLINILLPAYVWSAE